MRLTASGLIEALNASSDEDMPKLKGEILFHMERYKELALLQRKMNKEHVKMERRIMELQQSPAPASSSQ